jgi:hypothetical protein
LEIAVTCPRDNGQTAGVLIRKAAGVKR